MPVMLTHNFIRFLLSLHEKFKTPDIQELGPQNGSQYHPFATKKEREQNHTKSVKVFMNQIAY